MDVQTDDTRCVLTPATVDMCTTAFRAILTKFQSELPPTAPELPSEQAGVFVTWSVPRGRSATYVLRGCIGTLSPAPLDSAVERYATLAAFHDPRFDAIASSELPALKVGVSILSAFETASDVFDWKIGTHGLILEFGNGLYSATYLPEVCAEQGWTKEECIQSLAEKAGYSHPFTGRILETAVLTRYQSTKAELVYEQYLSLHSA